MEELKRKLMQDLGMSEEEFQQIKEKHKNGSITKQDLETLGNAIVVTFQNDNQLGDMVMSLLMQVDDLASNQLNLIQRVEALENA